MRPPQTNRPPSSRHVDVGLWAVGGLLALSGAVWAAAHLSALVTRRPVQLGLSDAGGLLVRWGVGLFVDEGPSPTPVLFGGREPAAALPASDLAIQLLTLALVLAAGVIVTGAWMLTGHGRLPGRAGAGRQRTAAHWGTARELASILVPGDDRSGRMVLGRFTRRIGRQLLVAVEELHSVFVLGPSQSRKTSSLAIPVLLEWQGPAVVTSVKLDLYQATALARWREGEVLVFDPAGLLGDQGATWDPLASVTSWAEARELARWLVQASAEHKEVGDATKGFFEQRSERPLAACIWAAVLDAKPIGWVRRRLDELGEPEAGSPRGEITPARYNDAAEDVLQVLAEHDQEDAIIALKSVLNETPNQRSGTVSSAQAAVDVFGDEHVEDACTPGRLSGGRIDPERLLDGTNTLYLSAPLHEQARLRPVFEALIQLVVRTAMTRTARTGRRLDSPLLVLLDEAGNVAPLENLAQLASTGAGQAIQLVTIFQDGAQLKHRYGRQAATVLNNHRAKLILSGLSDPDSLEYVSGLIGESAEVEESTTTAEDRESRTDHVAYRRLAPPALLRAIRPGEGVLVYGHLPPCKLRLRWWEADQDLARRAGPAEERRRVSGQNPGDRVLDDRRVVRLGRRRRGRRAA